MPAEFKDRATGEIQPHLILPTRERAGFLGIKNNIIPVFSVRIPEQHYQIAQATSSKKPVAFEAPGVFGILLAVENSRELNTNGHQFWTLKQGRERADKVPFMLPPRDLPRIIDLNKVHPDYHHLRNAKDREQFWGNLPFHLIGPVIDNIPVVRPEVFITTPEDSQKKPPDQYVPVSTVCAYFQNDEDWDNIARLSNRFTHRSLFGITSFNDNGEQPPFNIHELAQYMNLKTQNGSTTFLDIEAIVIDEAAEKTNIRSSQTQVRLPLPFESPELIIIRQGPVSPRMLSEQTGHPVKVLNSAKTASRGHPDNHDLTSYLIEFLDYSQRMIANRKSRVLV